MTATLSLSELTETCGVSGDESRVRRLISRAIAPLCDELFTDSMGNLIAVKGKDKPGPRLLLAAHMDEVGFIISGYHSSGLLYFKKVGSIDDSVLLGKHVWVGPRRLPGVIGGKPIHLLKKESERQRQPEADELYIDIGAKDKAAASQAVELGEYATFATRFSEFGPGLIKGKALDDRVGCRLLVDLLECDFPFPLYAAFTVQEEVGLRGAQIVAHRVQPDVALVLEGTTSAEKPDGKEHVVSTRLGRGPAISFMDRSTIGSRPLIRHLIATAEKYHIPYQIKEVVAGGTDAGSIHLSRAGVHTAVVSIPCRYIHAPAAVASRADIAHGRELLAKALGELPLVVSEGGDPIWSN
ncbi:MAG TPA: M42 family metallopeptidase [Firmicutes bacterium]|nr:M42 family metallopeptidase [Bacillota bacterium]